MGLESFFQKPSDLEELEKEVWDFFTAGTIPSGMSTEEVANCDFGVYPPRVIEAIAEIKRRRLLWVINN